MIPLNRANEILQLAAAMFEKLDAIELITHELNEEQCKNFAVITLRTYTFNRETWCRHLLDYLRPRIAKWLERTPADQEDRQIAAALIIAFIDNQMALVCPTKGVIERATIKIKFTNDPHPYQRVPGKSIQAPSIKSQIMQAKGGLN